MKVSFQKAVELLKQGKIVALPTETVYGIAACLNQLEGIQNIFKVKGRPLINPLIIHLACFEDLGDYVTHIPAKFKELSDAFWPGPLTCILPIKIEKIPSIVRANLLTGGFRIPDSTIVRELIRNTGPLVMPSANLSGKPSATQVEHVENDFGEGFPVLDGGRCTNGVESTIIGLDEQKKWVILRLGAIAPECFKQILGYVPRVIEKSSQSDVLPLCPGQLLRHYAPKAKIYLGEEDKLRLCSHILGFYERDYSAFRGKKVVYLGSDKNPKQVAENLYDILRQLDVEHVEHVWVDNDFPLDGLWLTIDERLKRASNND